VKSSASFRRIRVVGVLAAVVLAVWPVRSAPQDGQSGAGGTTPWPSPLDPQVVRDQDDMTWDDYKPIPGSTWNDPARVASVKTIRLAIVTADFPDFPFVMTMKKGSDLYGNPRVDPVTREEIPKFYADFWNKPQEINRGHTIHEYWMEQSRGKIGVAVTAFGPYRMPKKQFQYGGLRAEDLPAGDATPGNLNQDVDALWMADAGKDIRSEFDLVLRLFAGYDESGVWQEFGEMKFQTKEDITPEFGNPDPAKPRWVRTRYVEWTSWNAGSWLWSNSAIITGEASGAIRHEVSHAAFRIGDNYNNPYVTPYRRVGSGPWDVMDRGSFNGPGGPHKRYSVPKTEGDAMSAGVMLRQKINFGFVTPEQVLTINRNGLATSGLVVANVTARAIDPLPGSLAGIVVRLDGDAPTDRTPADDPATNPLSSGTPNFNFYSMEVVQRLGYDSFTPDNGVLLAKNKDQASTTGGPNGFSVFNWVIDAHPEDIGRVDFKRPNGTPVMRTIADYRQLNDALFHAGLNSGSQFEWTDVPNRLHFYVVDLKRDARGVLTYTLGVRSLDGAGPQVRGVALKGPSSGRFGAAPTGTVAFALANTGKSAAVPDGTHPANVNSYVDYDLYRLSVSVQGEGWSGALQSALAAVKFGETGSVPVFLSRTPKSASSATITVTATSESDPSKTTHVSYTIRP
jgi:M6 family metalloprotease-like protein